ncbi:uncharacterized protein LOC116347950 [Contarinia nasturtii]|uniref:uncharacterized protein LOC116347950 n=1 Tax=Contarinia nasturtii TaxID=265458 RepID=UPI0012D3FA22|nr:uncharacterized protein LOC116347950 [Contarinia nasturtii]
MKAVAGIALIALILLLSHQTNGAPNQQAKVDVSDTDIKALQRSNVYAIYTAGLLRPTEGFRKLGGVFISEKLQGKVVKFGFGGNNLVPDKKNKNVYNLNDLNMFEQIINDFGVKFNTLEVNMDNAGTIEEAFKIEQYFNQFKPNNIQEIVYRYKYMTKKF